jgi:WD40 repeat protein
VNISAKTWVRTFVSTTGAVVAGPTGAIVGSLFGSLLTSVIPGVGVFAGSVASALAARGILTAGEKIAGHLTPQEKQQINHDLQTAFRDAFREALFDIGGIECFPILHEKPARDVPEAVVFPCTSHGKVLWHDHNPLAAQVADLLQGIEKSLDSDQILALNPSADKPGASVKNYLEAETPHELETVFFEQNITPCLAAYRSLLIELPGIEAHLRKYLFPRTIVHLTENLKHRTPAWRAYNRMVLETMHSEIAQVTEGQNEILTRLDALVSGTDSTALAEWSDGMADLLGSIGKVETAVDEGFDEFSARVVGQHAELLARFDQISQTATRIESKVDRVLRFLDDGHYVIEGQSTVPLHRPPAAGEPPFMGLQYFDESNAGLFFGREKLVGHLVARLQSHHFLTVIGASGSGKSSVVRAGLIPVLKGEKVLAEAPVLPPGSVLWPVHIITPTDHPLISLAASLTRQSSSLDETRQLAADLARDEANLGLAVHRLLSQTKAEHLLLVIDQFEELFTLCQDAAEQKAFVDCLLKNAHPGSHAPLILVIILRADFYADCARFDNLRQAISEEQEYIGPMSTEELRRAIEEPALQGGWKFEPGLVDLLVKDAGTEPGALPLLSHALLETWRNRSSHTMTLESYAESGGVKGAIAKTAEMIYSQGLTLEQQTLARNIFLRLTNVGQGERETRRRVLLKELIPTGAQSAAIENVLHLLTDARLITTEQDSVELAHEAIIQEWPKLRGWLEENRAGLQIHRRLTEAAQEWAKTGNDAGMLYRGIRLDETTEWSKDKDNQLALNDLEREFLDASLDLRARETAEKEAQQVRELEAAQKLAAAEMQRAEEQALSARRLRRRAVYLTAALALAAILLVAAGFLGTAAELASRRASQNAATAQAASTQAIAQQSTAEAERSRAQEQELLAQVGQLAAHSQSAQLENYSQRSILLAIEAYRMIASQAGPQSLQAKNALWSSVASAGGKRLFGQPGAITVMTVSPDEHWLAASGTDFNIRLWDLTAPDKTPRSLTGHYYYITGLVFTPDSKTLVSASLDGTALLWDMQAADPGANPLVLNVHTDGILSAAVSPDGRWLVAGSMDNTARLWDLSASDPASTSRVLRGHTGQVNWVTISPDGHWMATASSDQTVRLWDLTAVDPAGASQVLAGAGAFVFRVRFSPDSQWLVSSGGEKVARLWDLILPDPGKAPIILSGHERAISGAIFSPDGRWLVTVSEDLTMRRWDLSTPGGNPASIALRGHTDLISGLVISPDGKWLVTVSLDHTARVWDLNAPDPNFTCKALYGHDGAISGVYITKDSKTLLTASEDGSVRKWEIGLPDPSPAPVVLRAHTGPINVLRFSPDSRLLASTAVDQTTVLYDAHVQKVTSVLTGHQKSIYSLVISPNGAWLVTTSWDETAILYNLHSGTPAASAIVLRGHQGYVSSAVFTADNRWLATGSKDGTVRLWDLQALGASPTPARIFEGNQNGVGFLAFDPSGRWLAAAAWEGMLRVWDLTDPDASPVILPDCTGPIAFSPDGKWLAADCYKDLTSEAFVWAMPDLTAKPFDLGHIGNTNYQMLFSPDSRWLVTAGSDWNAHVWDLSASDFASHPIVLRGHKSDIYALAISPDNRWLATGSYDQTIRLWDLTSPDPAIEAIVLRGHSGPVNSLDFSPDGHWLASGSNDMTVRLWTMHMDDLIPTGCSLAGRNLSQEEWNTYFYHQDYQKTCP